MTGLRALDKTAKDKSVENNIKQLVTEEAYSQISDKFPHLISFIVGVDILEMIDEKTAIGAAVLMAEGGRVLIPIIYTNGIVDATTFLYNEEFNTMLALTKKTAKFISNTATGIEGDVVTDNSIKNVDQGNIRGLFIPPKTYSPKIASSTGGLLFAVAEQYPLVKIALAKKLSTDYKYRTIFEDTYGHEAVEYIEKTAASHEQYQLSKDVTPPDVAFSIKEIATKDWIEKEAAFDEFGRYGYVISQGKFYPTKSLEKVASSLSKLKRLTGSDTIETIPDNQIGAFMAFDAVSLSPVPLILYKNKYGTPIIASKHNISVADKDRLATLCASGSSDFAGSSDLYNMRNNDNYIVGNRIGIFDAGAIPFMVARRYMEPMFCTGEYHVLLLKDAEIVFGARVSPDAITDLLGSTTIDVDDIKIVITRNSNQSYKKVGNVIYIGDAHVAVMREPMTISQKGAITLLTNNNADTQGTGEIVKVAYDSGDYYYNSRHYTLDGLVQQLLKEGYDKYSIYNLTKTAAEEGSTEMVAVNAKLDMLSQMVMNLAGKVETVASAIQRFQQDSSMQLGLANTVDPAQQQAVAQQLAAQQEATAQQQPIEQGAMADMSNVAQQSTFDNQGGGIYSQQEAAAQQQGPAAQQQAGLGAAEAQMPVPGDVPPQPQDAQQQVPEGMNPNIDPEVLQMLAQLKDSKVMDVGVLATLGLDSEISEIVSGYRDDILHGVSAIGRILFNMMVRKDALSAQYGDAKYKKITNSLRNIFVKTSDLYVDITMMGVEANVQVDN
jgi:hypothetical protein